MAEEASGSSKLRTRVRLIAAGVIVLLLVVIVLQNTESVQTDILFLSFTMPRAALLACAILLGFVVGVLTAGHLVRVGKKKGDAASKK